MSRIFVPAVAAALLACFGVCQARDTETVLYDFTGGADGGDPVAGLTKVGNTFYGTTYSGGAYGYGTVFSVTQSGTLSTLYAFKGAPDASQAIWPMLYKDGALYGVSRTGGEGGGSSGHGNKCKHADTGGCGTVFKITLDGQESILYAFSNTRKSDGFEPVGTLVALGGKFYGVTSYGGMGGRGTVYSLSKSGKEKTLYTFSDPVYGSPAAGLTVFNGTLYGTAGGEETIGNGEAFSITTAGNFTLLHQFGQAGDGSYPASPLLPLNGILYGTTEIGGAYRSGTLYTLTTDGSEKVITSFDKFADVPFGNLLLKGGRLHGASMGGGQYLGCVFKAAIAGGKFAAQHVFRGRSDGSLPAAGLVSVGGDLYGTTYAGGKFGRGTVFRLSE